MIKLINVTKEYKNGKEVIKALDNFSYEFKNNGFYAVVGPSGSGKSTLLNVLASLEHDVKGMVIYTNKDIIKYNEKKRVKYRRKNIGMIYQNSYLIPYLSLKDNISLNKKIDMALIEKLGIKQLLTRDITKLSGGQRQRVALARALSNNPLIVLADEPTGALDQNNSHKVMQILKNESKSKLVIMVSHDVKLCKQYCDIILYLDNGKLVKEEKNNVLNNIMLKKKKRIDRQSIFKLAFLFLKYKKKRTALASLCCSIGLIGLMLSLILCQGFTNFFKMQFDNSLNANSIYGYPSVRESVESISLFDIQNIAQDYHTKWGVFYDLDEDVKFDIKYDDKSIDWLTNISFFHYKIDESIDYLDTNSFVLSFPSEYYYVLSLLLNKEFKNEKEINQYLLNEEISFFFTISNKDKVSVLKLRLKEIKWNYKNIIEILHSSKFWIEDLSQNYDFDIETNLDKKGIVRYPYLYDYQKEDIEKILNCKKYQHISFDFDIKYGNKNICVGYYSKLSRITQEYLNDFLMYDEILDYLYLSNNGVGLELNIPSISINDIKGRDIAFSPLDLNNINQKNLLYGNIPKNNKEIIISKTLLDRLNISLNSMVKINHQLGKEIKVKVVGYIEGNNAMIIYHKGSWTYEFFINELNLSINDLPCYQISLHMKNKDNIPYYISFLNAQYEGCEFISPLYEASKEINKIMSYFEKGILMLSLFSIFVSLLLVGIIIFLNTIEQKKYDAILIMKGYSRKKIIKIHLVQNSLISLLSFLITMFMSYFIVVEVNLVFSLMTGVSYYTFAIISLSTIVKIFSCLLGCALISGYIPLMFLKLDDPLKILKE